jgi:hypothetical protein
MNQKAPPVASKAAGRRGGGGDGGGGGRNHPDDDQTALLGYPFNNPSSQGTRRASFAPRVVATAAKMDLKRELRKNHAYTLLQPCDNDEPVPGETEKEKKRRMNRINARRKRARRVLRVEHLTEQYHDLTERNDALKGQNSIYKSCISLVKGYMQSNELSIEIAQAQLDASLPASNDLKEPPRKPPPVAGDASNKPTSFFSPTSASAPHASFNAATAVGMNQSIGMAQPHNVPSSQAEGTQIQAPFDLNMITQLLQQASGNHSHSVPWASAPTPQALASKPPCGGAPPESSDLTTTLSNLLVQITHQHKSSMANTSVGCQQQRPPSTFDGYPTSLQGAQMHSQASGFSSAGTTTGTWSLPGSEVQSAGSSGYHASLQGTQALSQASSFADGKRYGGFSPAATTTGFSFLPATDGAQPAGNNLVDLESHLGRSSQNALDLPGLSILMGQLTNMLKSQNVSDTTLDAFTQFVLQVHHQSTSSTAKSGKDQTAPSSSIGPLRATGDSFSSTNAVTISNSFTDAQSGAQHSFSAQMCQPNRTGMAGANTYYMPLQAQQEDTNYCQPASPAPGPSPAPTSNQALTEIIIKAAVTNPQLLVEAWNHLANSAAMTSFSTATSG